MTCVFCDIVSERRPAMTVFRNDDIVAFLDHKPLFPGHLLVVPKKHYQTIEDVPVGLLEPLFASVRQLSIAVRTAMEAQGTFVAMNNRVSQSVPHLHVHVVPRTKGDGLKGFFWPRHPYRGAEHMAETRERIVTAIG